jgi:hypothetical protein
MNMEHCNLQNHLKKGNGKGGRIMERMNQFWVQNIYIRDIFHNKTPCVTITYNKNVFKMKDMIIK